MDAVRSRIAKPDADDAVARLRSKLAKRAGIPGYSANAAEIEERIATQESEQ